ncbi:MFS transporter [Cryobacterium tepidiphilum]|uniref:MFS transporter n=1 Tax=Cryobacterium tepidiphilum TaxID=2486026 RepID=A0A3M8LG48_9MICO|nr:MFS transporter [Cryobacterium tepidiphilum]RNE63702.1 MFS transporter [Cryobacterium tepidiphilum]
MTNRPRRPLWAGRILALSGILLVAWNLRTAVAALSPIITQVSADIPLGVLAVSVLGMLPPVCFAVFGIVTPMFSRWWGLEWSLVVALVAILAGHLLRGASGSLAMLMIASVIGFAGLGMGNVLLPPLVKKYFPDRIGLVTSLYATVLAVSTLVPPLVAVPVADTAGWRVSLGMWALLAGVAIVPWLAMIVRERRRAASPHPHPPTADVPVEEADPALLRGIWSSPIAWAIAVVFGTSSLNAYSMFAWLPELLQESAGLSPAHAGVMLSLFAGMGIPTGLVIPVLTARMKNVGLLVYLGALLFIVGDLGLMLLPGTATFVWVAFAGLGPLLFPLALVLINLRTRTHEAAIALSGFVQSVGYTLGALGPLFVGILREVTGGWFWPIVFLLATAVAATVAATVVARPHMLEDDLAARER